MTNTWSAIKSARLIFVIGGMSLMAIGVAVLSNGYVDSLLLSAVTLWKGLPPGPHWLVKRNFLAINTLVVGAVLAIFGWLILPRWTWVTSLARKERFLLVTATLMLVTFWLPVVLVGRSETIAGERYWWLSDDAMISMRYARNLANGFGLVWNPGERVEGYTNFLWTIVMTLVHLLPIDISKTALVVLLINVLLAAAIVPVIIWLVHILGGGKLATVAALVGYVFSKHAMAWTTIGFETTLLTFLLLFTMYRVLQESQLNQPRLLTYLLIAMMSLVRADTIVLSVLMYAVAMLLIKNRKVVLIYSVISLLLPAMHELFRLYYYGDLLPNTAYLKTSNWSGRYAAGLVYVREFAKHYALLIIFAVVGVIRSRQWSWYSLLSVFLLYTAYVAYVGGDAFGGFRFFVPILPLLAILAFVGIRNLGLQPALRLAIGILCLVTLPLITPGYTDFLFPNSADTGNVRIGLLLKQNTPAASKIADFWAGSVFYFSERYAIDLLGKSDRRIAHLPVASNGTKPGHNKFDFDYSLGVLRPDFVVGNFNLPVQEDTMRRAATGDWAFTGQLYFNAVFHEHCFPNPITVETWRTIFVCDWSPQIERKDRWKDLTFISQ